MLEESLLPMIERKKINLILSNKQITIRPYLVKEEKILLMGKEEAKNQNNNELLFDAIFQILDNCILEPDGKDKKQFLANLAYNELENIFLELRKMSKGEEISLILPCSKCEKTETKKFNFNEIIKKQEGNKDDKILIQENLYVRLKSITTHFIKKNKRGGKDFMYNLIANHIDSILHGDKARKILNPQEGQQFIDNLKIEKFEELEKWFNNETSLYLEIPWECPNCKNRNITKEFGILDFLAI